MGRKSNLGLSFNRARDAAITFHSGQTAWLDANGNGKPNENEDIALASQRGFEIAGSLDGQKWPPHIAELTMPITITNGQGQLSAKVVDDQSVNFVWAAVYPPSYSAPESSEALVNDEASGAITVLKLTPGQNDQFSVSYPGFTQPGEYRIVVYAEDGDGVEALPKVGIVTIAGSRVFLPLVAR